MLLQVFFLCSCFDVDSEDCIEGDLDWLRWDQRNCGTRHFRAERIFKGVNFLIYLILRLCISFVVLFVRWIPNFPFAVKDRLSLDWGQKTDYHDSQLIEKHTPDKDRQVPNHDEFLSLFWCQLDEVLQSFPDLIIATIDRQYRGHAQCKQPEKPEKDDAN